MSDPRVIFEGEVDDSRAFHVESAVLAVVRRSEALQAMSKAWASWSHLTTGKSNLECQIRHGGPTGVRAYFDAGLGEENRFDKVLFAVILGRVAEEVLEDNGLGPGEAAFVLDVGVYIKEVGVGGVEGLQ